MNNSAFLHTLRGAFDKIESLCDRSKAYLEPNRTSMMECFCKNSKGLLAVNYWCKLAPLYIFEWVLNTPLVFQLKHLRLK